MHYVAENTTLLHYKLIFLSKVQIMLCCVVLWCVVLKLGSH